MLWIIFGLMLLVAALAIAWPLYRHEQRLSLRAAGSIVFVLAVSAVIYAQIGRPDATSATGTHPGAGGQQAAELDEMIESLAARLKSEPGNLEGWKMLARSYLVTQRYPEAIAAFERAVELENGTNGQTLVDLGEAVLMNDGSALTGRAGQLFENAIALTPDNPKALFYGGYAAVERGDRELAADRWERLLQTSPPAEIEGILRQKIAEWRGEEAPAPAAVAETPAGPPPVVTVDVRLGDAASAEIGPATTVFVIARDPAQPGPPLAAVRLQAGELPKQVALSDADAMMAGRPLSAAGELEIVARTSLGGTPVAQPGDWFGQARIDPAADDTLAIVIDQRVP